MRRFKFIGRDGSCGYKNGKKYWGYLDVDFGHINVEFVPLNPRRTPIRYTDFHAFLANWEEI